MREQALWIFESWYKSFVAPADIAGLYATAVLVYHFCIAFHIYFALSENLYRLLDNT